MYKFLWKTRILQFHWSHRWIKVKVAYSKIKLDFYSIDKDISIRNNRMRVLFLRDGVVIVLGQTLICFLSNWWRHKPCVCSINYGCYRVLSDAFSHHFDRVVRMRLRDARLSITPSQRRRSCVFQKCVYEWLDVVCRHFAIRTTKQQCEEKKPVASDCVGYSHT